MDCVADGAVFFTASVKQVLTIMLVFDLTLTALNILGILLSLVGGALYARVECFERKLVSSL